jgi:hypothetical protein
MGSVLRRLRLSSLAMAFVVLSVPALAAPPSSCACKFVGEWVYPGGSTTVFANGTAKPKCAFCVPMQSWTCNGNTYYFSNSGPPGQFTATLVGENRMQYSGGVATRVHAGACSAGAGEKKSKDNAGCATPGPGRTIRQADQQCIQATNTNSEPKCKYRYVYVSSITKKMVGPVVSAGKTDTSVCGRPGETLTFQKWEQVPVSAR